MTITQEDLDSKPIHKIILKMLDSEELKYKTRKEIYQSLTSFGLRVTENKVWTEVNYHHEEFYLLQNGKTHLIGLRKWVPVFFKTKRATRKFTEDKELLHSSHIDDSSENYFDSSKIIYHILNSEEIKHGYIHLNPSFVGLFSDMSSNLEVIPLKVICFNRNIFQGWLKNVNNLFYCEDFKNYFNNRYKIGDIIKYQKDNKSSDGIFFHIDMVKNNKLLLLNSGINPNIVAIPTKTTTIRSQSKADVNLNKKMYIFIAIVFVIIAYILLS